MLVGCRGELPTAPVKQDAASLLGRLDINYKTIVLSLHAPYDTVRLDAIPRNLYGDELPYSGKFTFRRLNILDQTVSVDSNGLVTANAATSATKVEVSLILDGVMRSDTATIMVRGESPVVKIARLEFSPQAPDSAWRWAGNGALLPTANWVRLYNEQNQLIPNNRAAIGFSWDNPGVVGQARYIDIYSNRTLGESWIHAKVYAYDTILSDSFLFRRIEPTIKFVVIDRIVPVIGPPSMVFYPSELEVQTGSTIVFMNRSGTGDLPNTKDFWGNRILRATNFNDYMLQWVDSTDIVFDNPTNVLTGDSYRNVGVKEFNVTFLTDGGSGNIPSFSWVLCKRVNVDNPIVCNGNATEIVDIGYRSRKFNTVGTYHYSSTQFPGAHGTIIVKEKQ